MPAQHKKSTMRRARIDVAVQEEEAALAELKGASVGFNDSPGPPSTSRLRAAAVAWVVAAEAVMKARTQ